MIATTFSISDSKIKIPRIEKTRTIDDNSRETKSFNTSIFNTLRTKNIFTDGLAHMSAHPINDRERAGLRPIGKSTVSSKDVLCRSVTFQWSNYYTTLHVEEKNCAVEATFNVLDRTQMRLITTFIPNSIYQCKGQEHSTGRWQNPKNPEESHACGQFLGEPPSRGVRENESLTRATLYK